MKKRFRFMSAMLVVLVAMAANVLDAQAQTKFKVTFTVDDPAHGTISAMKLDSATAITGTAINTGDSVEAGKTVKFKVDTAVNFRIKQWIVNGTPVVGRADSVYKIPNLATDVVVRAELEAVPIPPARKPITFTVVGNRGGTLTATVEGLSIHTGDSIEVGKTVNFKADTFPNFRVKQWTKDGLPLAHTDTTYTLTVAADHEVTLAFDTIIVVPARKPVTFDVVNNRGGRLTASVDGNRIQSGDSVVVGKTVVFRASPAPNFHLKEWKVDGRVPNTLDTTLNLVVSRDHAVTVEYDSVVPKHAIYYSVLNNVGAELTATVGARRIANGDSVLSGLKVVFSAKLAPGYKVKHWTDNGRVTHGLLLPDTVYSIAALDTTHTVMLICEREKPLVKSYPVVFNADTVTNGTVTAMVLDSATAVTGTAISSGDMVEAGKTVVFRAVPAKGYIIDMWVDNSMPIQRTDSVYRIASLDTAHNVRVLFKVSTANEAIVDEATLKVYPNPATDQVTVESDNLDTTIEVYTLAGRLVSTQPKRETAVTVQLGRLPQGVYLLRSGKQTVKVLKR